MEALHIEASEDTPKIYFEPEVEIYLLEGKSLPENAIDFYGPVFDWAKKFFESSDVPDSVVINFKFDYFNTASSKQIAKLLRIIEDSPNNEKVTIKWYYDEEDTDMLKAGNRYNKLMNIHFEFVMNKE
ncbi:MAG: nuclear pore complex subunit [Bacteroidetes bacterium]|nr:MAG: nuclear pore complex subunit [Bacteroidota bacterium]